MPTPSAETAQTPRFQVKRDAILGAAALLFNEQGVKGATLSGIAASVGLATNSVTYYYRRKEDLATACFLRSIAAFEALADAAAREQRGVAARIQAFVREHALLLADIEEGRQAPIVSFSDIRALPDAQANDVFAAYTAMFRRVRALLQGAETAQLGRDDLNARAHMLLSIALWTRTWIGRYEAAEYPRVAERIGDLLIRGLAGTGAAWCARDTERTWQLTSGADSTSEAFPEAGWTVQLGYFPTQQLGLFASVFFGWRDNRYNATLFETRTTAEWIDLLTKADVPVMPMHDLASILHDEHLEATGFFPVVNHPTEGPIRSMKVTATWSETEAEPVRLAPRLNEHGAEILREAGYSPDEIAAMVRDGVTRSPPEQGGAP